MNKMKKISYIFIVTLLCTICNVGQGELAKAASPSVEYQAHIANEGWKSYQSNGATGGSTGKSLSLQALKIRIRGISGGITYRAHLSNIGWTSWVSNNNQVGTTGQNRPMEAIQINLTGDATRNYDVYYRVHVSNVGWLGWTKNGNVAGSTGCSLPMEAIQIKILAKDNGMATSQSSIKKPSLTVQAHVEDIGWQKPVSENTVAGTTGYSKRMEAMIIRCSNFMGGNGIQYRAHVQDIGWQNWCDSGICSGTTGRSLQMEAVQIKLVGKISTVYDVYYRVHCADYGWLGWACNGESAGTTSGGIRMEAIQVKLVRKGTSVSRGGTAYMDLKGKMVTAFQMPLVGARCTWRSYTNWSWGNNSGAGGSRVYHLGIDIIGTSDNVMAAAKGTVAQCGYNGANGNYVVLKHTISGQTVYSFYAHLASYSVKRGNTVSKGAKIGIVGNTGSSSRGKHLHFAMMNTLWNGSYYGYSTYFTGNKTTYAGVTYYNPIYVIQNNRLP